VHKVRACSSWQIIHTAGWTVTSTFLRMWLHLARAHALLGIEVDPETIVGPITFELNFRVLRLLLTEREHVSLSILVCNFL
jgi:hypothetical protein